MGCCQSSSGKSASTSPWVASFSVNGQGYSWTDDSIAGYSYGLTVDESAAYYCVNESTQERIVGIRFEQGISDGDELKILKRLAQEVKHDHLLPINAFEGTRHTVILTCEMLGGDLFESIASGQLPELGAPGCLRLCSQLLAAVAHLHQLKIIHRDVKPENILLSCEDVSTATLRLSNFSLAVGNADGHLAKQACGTPSYVAPEVLSQQGYYCQADCWSVGVTFYAMITGEDPWGGLEGVGLDGDWDEQDWDCQLYKKIKQCDWDEKLFQEGVGVTDEVVAFIKTLLCVDPRVRARSANAMQRARQLWLQLDSSAELDEDNPDMSWPAAPQKNLVAISPSSQMGPSGTQFPEYWRNITPYKEFRGRSEMCLPAFIEQLKVLLDQTFKSKATRDRKGDMPNGLRMIEAHRVEDSVLWNQYATAKMALRAKRGAVTPFHDLDGDDNEETGQLRTTTALGDFSSRLDHSINECYLFHGTSPEAAQSISETGFCIAKAGSSVGTMFGKGAYFAEASSKADEYAQRGAGIYAKSFAMLVCRVVCGEMFRMTKANDDALEAALASNLYDGVLGDREASVGTYREFVVFDGALIYPEYVVVYEHI